METKLISKSKRFNFRVSSEQKALIEHAAMYSGASVTSFAMNALLEKARDVVQQHEVVMLSMRDTKRFMEIMESDYTPSEEAKEEAKRYRQSVKQG
jgi:uncharacterized protein (DUF1778 family)